MRRKYISSLIAGLFAVIIAIMPVTAYADGSYTEKDEKWDVNKAWFSKLFEDCEDCNFIRTGGVNKLDGITAETRAETHALENHLIENNFVLASTTQREITDEDVEMLSSIRWVGASYIGDVPFLSDGKHFKVYIYNETLQTARKQWKEHHALDFHVQWEITTGSVLINYYTFDELDKVGKTFGTEEINEKMPIQYQTNAGFVEFNCPIDAEIKLLSADHGYYYLLYLQKGKTLMKLRGDHYELVEINGKEVARGDIALTNGNYFVVWQQPEDAPLQVEFSKLIERDNIKGIDVTGKPNCKWGAVYEDVDVKDEGDVTVDESTDGSENEKAYESKTSNFKGIIAAGVIAVVFGILVVLIIRKKR